MSKMLKKVAMLTCAAAMCGNLFAEKLIEEREGCKLILKDEANQRYLVYLHGGPKQRGYNHGWLLAEQVRYTCSDQFVKDLVGGLLGAHVPAVKKIMNNPKLFRTILDLVSVAASKMSIWATREMRHEMRYIAKGAIDRLRRDGKPTHTVSYRRIVLANMGFDIACAVVYPFVVRQLAAQGDLESIRAIQQHLHACDGFVVDKAGSATGGTLMGRNFMNDRKNFGPKGYMFEYKPSYGNRFVGHSFAGSVGFPVGMNDQGVAMGMDMASTVKTNPAAVGMGCLLQTRYTLQYMDDLDSAKSSVQWAISRGTPWIYIIGDAKRGAIVEAGATALFGGINSGGKPDYFAVRYTDTVIDDKGHAQKGVGQFENNPNYAVASNHFINKRLVNKSGSKAVKDSLWRYNFLNRMMKKEMASTDKFTFAEAKALVNYQDWQRNGEFNKYADEIFLHRKDGYKWRAHNYTWGAKPVGGSVSAFDCKNKIMAIKYNMHAMPFFTFQFPNDGYDNDARKPWWRRWR